MSHCRFCWLLSRYVLSVFRDFMRRFVKMRSTSLMETDLFSWRWIDKSTYQVPCSCWYSSKLTISNLSAAPLHLHILGKDWHKENFFERQIYCLEMSFEMSGGAWVVALTVGGEEGRGGQRLTDGWWWLLIMPQSDRDLFPALMLQAGRHM